MAKKELRSGISTGASAAAAAKAAALMLTKNEAVPIVTVTNLQGREIRVPIKNCARTSQGAEAIVVKDGGDDPDVTHGLDIVAEVRYSPAGITVLGGQGVGIVTKPGLQVPVGEYAINPVPRQMIMQAVKEVLPPGQGATVVISVPGGEEKARRTLNPKLGIIGGISILGTTGIVEPMSEERFKASLVPQIKMAQACGFQQILLTPGKIGECMATEQYGFPADAVLQMSNFVGFMLRSCVDEGMKKVILWGHHGKLVKVAAGSFNTHSKVADGRLETIAAYAGMAGAGPGVLHDIMQSVTAEGVLDILRENRLMEVFPRLADVASKKAMQHVYNQLLVGTVMLDMKGNILGADDNARAIGRELGCRML